MDRILTERTFILSMSRLAIASLSAVAFSDDGKRLSYARRIVDRDLWLASLGEVGGKKNLGN